MIHTITFNPVVDLIYHVPHFQKGTTFRCADFQMVPAGKGINVSYALSCLEETSATYTILNEACFPLYQHACSQHGITFLPVTGPVMMRYHATLLDNGDRTVTHIQTKGEPVSPLLADRLIDTLINRLNPRDIVVISGSLPLGIDPSIYSVMIEECKDYQALVVLDASGEPLAKGVAARPFVVKINQSETEELVGFPLESLEAGAQAMMVLQSRHAVPILILTLGAGGMIAGTPQGIWHVSLPMAEEEVVDTVGCGDALAAGLAYGLARNKSEADLFRYAIACASAAARHAGPSHFQKTELPPLLERVRIQRLGSV
ncbi:MAG: hexose kinase [bacterium]|jgi:tagatose 6-phosphate kinase|nr:hexose kinase [bacterium]